MLMVQWSCK